MNKKFAFIMRGIPGSGKSTVAKYLCGENGVICSADDHFMIDGEYKWNAAGLGAAHGNCFRKFQQAAERGESPLILDNTNIKVSQFDKYIAICEKYGYIYSIIQLPLIDASLAASRNVHRVPQEAIERMIAQFEPYDKDSLKP